MYSIPHLILSTTYELGILITQLVSVKSPNLITQVSPPRVVCTLEPAHVAYESRFKLGDFVGKLLNKPLFKIKLHKLRVKLIIIQAKVINTPISSLSKYLTTFFNTLHSIIVYALGIIYTHYICKGNHSVHTLLCISPTPCCVMSH